MEIAIIYVMMLIIASLATREPILKFAILIATFLVTPLSPPLAILGFMVLFPLTLFGG